MKQKLVLLIAISTIIRLFLAWAVELGNDEVYYRIFALYPDYSYFDHPPIVSWLIWLTTGGAGIADELFVRLGAVVIGSVNTYLIFKLTQRITDSERTGFFAALLYTGSIYASIICGTFIMPDTPLSLFWLAAMLFFAKSIGAKSTSYNHSAMLLAGACAGLAMLSKYTGAYLWAAAGLYILFFNRKWLKQWSLYVSPLISAAVFLPVILWNINNDFITFTFHGSRVTAEQSINWLYFGREIFGSIFYNNPVNWTLAILAMIAWWRSGKMADSERFISQRRFYFLLTFSLPMIVLFLGISLTRETLPHWAAPAYFALIILAAAYLNTFKKGALAITLSSIGLTFVVGILAVVQVNFGLLKLDTETDPYRKGRTDFSLDMYGWKQGGELFAELRDRDTLMPKDAPLVQYGWDDAAHVACYFGQPLALKTKAMGDINSTHYWEWINRREGGFRAGDSVYLITSSRYALNPYALYSTDFTTIMPADTLKIQRNGEHVYNFYVYRMLGLRPESRYLRSQIP